MLELVSRINHAVNTFVWGIPVLALLLAAGVLTTLFSGGFQFRYVRHWLQQTLGSLFQKSVSGHSKEKGSISQFQALCTALAATVGVGNIAGVATAIVCGGPGAVFWMWVAAIFGTMTNFSETVLGLYYRRKNKEGEWAGGAMYYLADGLGSKKGCRKLGKTLAALFALFTVLASFGIGNASQVNTIAVNLHAAFFVPVRVTGVVLTVLAGLVIVGGIRRIARVTETVIPFMVVAYLLGTLAVIAANVEMVPAALRAIVSFAFGLRAAGGGVLGAGVAGAVRWGLKRGVFSNEAGLGSSVIVHAASNVKEPVRQGMWGIFEVCVDTLVVCTLTALVILTSGLVDLKTGAMLTTSQNTVLVAGAFSRVFGNAGASFIAVAILLFAFSTVLGWSYYGAKAWEYLFGTRAVLLYKVLFVLFIYVGATMRLELAWEISDTFNGLMALPNLIGVLVLTPLVVQITENYLARVVKGQPVAPMRAAPVEDAMAYHEL